MSRRPARRASRAERLRRALGLASATVLLATGAAACGTSDGGDGGGSGPELTVEGAYMPKPVTADTAGGFMTIRNSGDTADRLTSVRSDISGDVQIHRTVDQRMRRMPSLPVPAHGTLELSRGGDHLMLLDLSRVPAEGEKVSMELRFEKSGPITVEVPVEAANHDPHHH
ncbi:MAG TPA: copper chaperone PCu(A)C [Streptomyces sp.]|nr:copper chaperone PCu(A)C [Streptomyces sp.]